LVGGLRDLRKHESNKKGKGHWSERKNADERRERGTPKIRGCRARSTVLYEHHTMPAFKLRPEHGTRSDNQGRP